MAPRPPVQAVVRGGGSRQLRAACPRLFRDILAVLSGLRPAFMLDYGMLAPECLAAAAADLARALRLAEAAAELCVAVLGDCCYLVRPGLLPSLAGVPAGAGGEQTRQQAQQAQQAQQEQAQQEQAQQQQGDPPLAAAPAVLFVAFDGQRVRWAAGAEAGEAAAQLQALRQGLLQAVQEAQQRQPQQHKPSSHTSSKSSCRSSGSISVVDAEALPGWREGLVPPTASGYLLGYPAIYLCHSLEGAQAASRCLSTGGLCLHSATCQLRATAGVPQLDGQQPLLAFSVPAELAAAPEWEACRAAWHARLQQQHSRAVKHHGLPWGELQMAANGAGPRPVAL